MRDETSQQLEDVQQEEEKSIQTDYDGVWMAQSSGC